MDPPAREESFLVNSASEKAAGKQIAIPVLKRTREPTAGSRRIQARCRDGNSPNEHHELRWRFLRAEPVKRQRRFVFFNTA
jgi:hypothetical protein